MTAVDVGSSLIKWFDGKNFGLGLKKDKNLVTGISSKTVFVKKSFYPVCRGSQLKRIILNDISTDIGVEPEKLAVSFCPLSKSKKGCEFLIFIEKKEVIDSLNEKFEDSSIITIDFIGAFTAASLLYGEEDLTIVDFGASKTAILTIKSGKLKDVEIVRTGFSFLKENEKFLRERILSKISGKIVVIGGGALDSEFIELVKKNTKYLDIPNIEPFGKETPLYFSVFGLYHFRKATCKASFKEFSLFSSEFFSKHKSSLRIFGIILIVSSLLITVSQFLSYLYEKRNYELVSKEYRKELEKILGEKVLAPEIQVSQKLSTFKELGSFLLVDKPSILFPLSKISRSVVKGINVLKLEGSIVSESFQIYGYADKEESIKKFTDNLLKYFKKVNTHKIKKVGSRIQFLISASGVKKSD
ncbi:hypothetical protein Dester_1333 [Desulfurobacterium thermolithotrophum DSM 11699]|uniref:Uncharacterized protein n=1 Tax=Desulfurobacterium thermolithotrophum (strain DSM 11699 / BSA) TaxID=868864 RepID=F0S1G2_DESTD|nr:hypothetical protein [Desulfurobacterium thermolithotrophum]ADY73965.1 hypothetical protein Dester_1333 [Desulfurobacterium thermolithotrophum DSM 11699]